MLINVMIVFAQEHGHEFNGDHALQELYDYVRRYQDQVNIAFTNFVSGVLSLPRESILVTAGHVSARFSRFQKND